MNTVIHAHTPSSLSKRIAAFIIDHCMIGFLMMLIILSILGPNFIDGDNSGNLSSIMLSVMLPGFLLYFVKDSIKGISFGRWMMGVMVRDAISPDEIPSFGRLFARNLFLVIWPVELIVLATSQEKRRLGDKTTKTIVVENSNKAAKLPRTIAVTAISVIIFVFMFLFVGSALKNSEAYKVAIQEIEANEEILRETGGIEGYGLMPTGSINVSNDSGQAQFSIKVIGNTKNLKVNVYLTKEPEGKWNLIEIKN